MGPDQELDRLMQKRSVPEMRSNLAERIIDTAYQQTQQERRKRKSWLHTFNDIFLIPKPAFVIAALFMIGIAMGMSVDMSDATIQGETVSAYFYTAETVTEGDWL